jgi:DDE superfamily endonuclease
MTSIYRQQEERIDEAIRSLGDATCTNIASLARAFNCPEQRLRKRLAGAPSKLQNKNRDERLSESQDIAVMNTLDRLEDCGLHARIPMLTSIANSILRQSYNPHTEFKPVSHMWASRWIKRFPQYQIVTGKPLAVERRNAHDPNVLRGWFEKYHKVVTENGILPGDISNVDETGFRVGVGRRHKVIGKDQSKKIYMPDADNRQHVTVVECVQADGSIIPPMVIIPGKRHLERMFPDGLQDDVLMAVSDTGYNNDDLSLAWLHHYDQHTKNRRQGFWRLLIFDGFGSHLLIDFIRYCWDNHIIPLVLPPHATHLMQPLDVVIFQPYKHYHSEALDRAIRIGFDEFTVQDFLQELHGIRKQTFKTSTVISSFRATGLIPYDPAVVLDKLMSVPDQDDWMYETCDTGLDLDITPDEESWLTDQITPQNVRQFEVAQADIYRSMMNLTGEFEDFRYQLGKFMKGALATAQTGQLAIDELTAVRRAVQSRRSRTLTSGRMVQKGGVVTVEQARHKIRKRVEDDDAKLVRLLKARDDREARIEAKAIERAEIDERKRIRAITAAEKKQIIETRRVKRAEATQLTQSIRARSESVDPIAT